MKWSVRLVVALLLLATPAAAQVRGLPVGLQLVGPHFAEERLLQVAHQYQLLTDWHRACPGAFA